MISSFQVLESLTAPTPADLAKGVYESLVNTTMGLFISIVFLTASFFMKNKVSDIALETNPSIAICPRRRKETAGSRARLAIILGS